MNSPTISSPYLITSRIFPKQEELSPALTKMYIDIALAVNARVIGIFDKFRVVTGKQWFNDQEPQKKRQSYRDVYTIPSILEGITTIVPYQLFPETTIFVKFELTANDKTNFSFPALQTNINTPNDSIQVRYNWKNGKIELLTTTNHWLSYNAILIVEYLLN